jgi:C-terminal processing protease CtpA/Prc
VAEDWVGYVVEALDLLEEHYYKTDAVDWVAVRAVALGIVQARPGKDTAYTAIERALGEMEAYHSFFAAYREIPSGTVVHTDPPTGERLDLGTGAAVGFVALPSVNALSDQWITYPAQVHDLMREADRENPVCGWVVDLRETGGGVLPPFLLSVGPLLGEEVVLSYVGPDGNGQYSYQDGQLFFNGSPFVDQEIPADRDPELVAAYLEMMTITDPYTPHDPDAPVAVLISDQTVSASEGVLVAFLGRPDTRTFGLTASSGFPTGNVGFPLPDGATLTITVAQAQDRLGNVYDDSIPPDEYVLTPTTDGQDPILGAALQWLTAQPGCQRG